MKRNPVVTVRLRMRFIANHDEAVERVATQLENIAKGLRARRPELMLRRLPVDAVCEPSADAQHWIGEVDFHWRGGA